MGTDVAADHTGTYVVRSVTNVRVDPPEQVRDFIDDVRRFFADSTNIEGLIRGDANESDARGGVDVVLDVRTPSFATAEEITDEVIDALLDRTSGDPPVPPVAQTRRGSNLLTPA
jgi:hypothetical protein